MFFFFPQRCCIVYNSKLCLWSTSCCWDGLLEHDPMLWSLVCSEPTLTSCLVSTACSSQTLVLVSMFLRFVRCQLALQLCWWHSEEPGITVSSAGHWLLQGWHQQPQGSWEAFVTLLLRWFRCILVEQHEETPSSSVSLPSRTLLQCTVIQLE